MEYHTRPLQNVLPSNSFLQSFEPDQEKENSYAELNPVKPFSIPTAPVFDNSTVETTQKTQSISVLKP